MTHTLDDIIHNVKHPARFTDSILEAAFNMLDFRFQGDTPTLYDPFAGTGKGVEYFAERGWDVWGTELEPEWAAQSANVDCCDSLQWMAQRALLMRSPLFGRPMPGFDVVFTSPCYGNRLADHHEAKDASKRITYRHQLGRPLTEGSAAGMQWGDTYKRFHAQAWSLVYDVLKPGGYFLLNVSDHIRKGQRQEVVEWHVTTCLAVGFQLVEHAKVTTPRQRYGANGAMRVESESLVLLRKPL